MIENDQVKIGGSLSDSYVNSPNPNLISLLLGADDAIYYNDAMHTCVAVLGESFMSCSCED